MDFTKELQRQKDVKYNQWINHYKNDLDELYNIFLKYKYISYDDFLLFAYDCTLEYYDFTSKSNKKFLI